MLVLLSASDHHVSSNQGCHQRLTAQQEHLQATVARAAVVTAAAVLAKTSAALAVMETNPMK